MKRNLVAVALATLGLAACGIPEEKYKAAVEDGNKAKAAQASEAEKVKALEAKVADLQAKVAATEATAAGAAAEAQRQATKARSLEQTTAQLAAEKKALEQRSAEYERLTRTLATEIQSGRIQISELEGKMTVRLADKVLFPSGSATLAKDGKATLAKVADAFKDLKDRIVRVEGHTDNVRVGKSSPFASNWELSSARAIAVVRFLEGAGVDPAKLAAAGYAEFQPIAPNDTPEGRSQNRRIEISLAAAPAATPAVR